MAYVTVPKDLSRVKTKVALNLTKRQLTCFGAAALLGVPAYLAIRGAAGNTAAALMMMALMFPFFFLAIYEKDGLPAERMLLHVIRSRLAWPGRRPYMTENFYEALGKEASKNAAESTGTAKTPVGQRKTGQGKPRGHGQGRQRRG